VIMRATQLGVTAAQKRDFAGYSLGIVRGCPRESAKRW